MSTQLYHKSSLFDNPTPDLDDAAHVDITMQRHLSEMSRASVTEQISGGLGICGVIEASAETLDRHTPNKLDSICDPTGVADLPSGKRSPCSDRGATDAKGVPPASNTGVQITESTATVDWLSFTMPFSGEGFTTETAAREVKDLLSDAGEPLERGAMGYTHGWKIPGGGRVLHRPDRPDMNIHVSLPSGALPYLRIAPMDLLRWVFANGGRVTRLDVALDNYETPIAVVDEAIRAGHLVSRSTNRTYQGGYNEGGGFTIYIGSRSSDRFVRFYDKAAEQGRGDGEVWTRCEVEFKGDQAQAAAHHILNGVDLRSLVFSAVDFRDRSSGDNVTRCDRLDWWSAWVGAVDRVKFAVTSAVVKTAEQVYEWVRKAVAPSLAFLDEFFGKHPTWMFELVDANKHRISSERKLMLMGAT
jgi:phage replication initiation protein